MNMIDRIIAPFAPERALKRAQARAALGILMNYQAATSSPRGSAWWKAGNADADAAASRRDRLTAISRDMIRNTPLATRGQSVITNNVVGDGIIPKVKARSKARQKYLLSLVERHLDTTLIDADGRQNLYGLQRLVMNSVVDAGEVLIRRRRRRPSDNLPVPLQLQVLEADYLDTTKEGAAGAGYIREGIEYNAIGQRVAYWLYDEHPGTNTLQPRGWQSRRVPAEDVIHIYRQDRPGQKRGVTWFAPVALSLQDLADGTDAHLMRQKIAACFAGFITEMDGEPVQAGSSVTETLDSIRPGRLQKLQPGQSVVFPQPPSVDGYEDFNRVVLRQVASGLGITYEALTGDLSNVNFSSARMGRIEMNRNVQSWQYLLIIPQMLQPIAQWWLEAVGAGLAVELGPDVALSWVPPTPVMVDPQRETSAARDAIRAGLKSRQQVVREMGFDPERVLEEQIEDARTADDAGLVFDSDARTARAGQAAPVQPGPERTGDDDDE